MILLYIMHQILLRIWSNCLLNNPPKRRVLNLKFAQSTIPCVAFESYELFISALATGLWTQS